MGLSDIVRSGIALADSLTGSLQVPVKHYMYSEATIDDTGKITWAAPHVRMGIVENARTQQRQKESRDVASDVQVTFPRPFPIDTRDKLVMPDGNGDTVINRVAGVFDPLTNDIYMIQVWIGSSRIT
jgi:hypothetical protein